MKIVQLTAENVKRIKAVNIRPDGSVVQITGRNAQGKSSVLDSIEMALGGGAHICAKPVRAGTEKARIVCTLDNGLVIKRTFTAAGGSALIVENGEGARFSSPQAMLDKLVGRLTFDPLAFTRMPGKQQLETLKQLVGLDFTYQDQHRAEIYAERTDVSRRVAQLKTQLDQTPAHPDAPTEEVSVADLMQRLQQSNAFNEQVIQRQTDAVSDARILARCQDDVRELERKYAEAVSRLNKQQAIVDQQASRPPAVKIDTTAIQTEITGAEAVNAKVRSNRRRAEFADHLASAADEVNRLTAAISEVDSAKQAALVSASFPVPGLSFDETGVLFNGIPFEQASSAEQMRASTAIGLAMNPQLRVMLIRDGSLLDKQGLELLAEFAATNDAQVWVERVDDTGEVGVVIEDGCVASTGGDDCP